MRRIYLMLITVAILLLALQVMLQSVSQYIVKSSRDHTLPTSIRHLQSQCRPSFLLLGVVTVQKLLWYAYS